MERYARIPDPLRFEIIRLYMEKKHTLTDIASRTGCKYENVKLICKIFRETGRIRNVPEGLKRKFPMMMRDPDSVRSQVSPREWEVLQQLWHQVWSS